jgi:hypothetical protein
VELQKLNSFLGLVELLENRSYFLFPPFFLIKKVEPKNQGCRKPAKNARIPAKEKLVTARE